MNRPPQHLRPPESDLRRAEALLRRLEATELRAAIPVLEKYALSEGGGVSTVAERTGESHPPVPFSVFADHMETLTDMLFDSDHDVESPECHAVGAFILNHGTREEAAEALLALMPIATRVYRRWESAVEASLAKSRAAVKGKKVGKGGASNGA